MPRRVIEPGHSCVECRRRKIKCDRASPCSYCIKNRIDCAYPPAKAGSSGNTAPVDRDVVERIEAMEEDMKAFGAKLDKMQDMLQVFLSSLSTGGNLATLQTSSHDNMHEHTKETSPGTSVQTNVDSESPEALPSSAASPAISPDNISTDSNFRRQPPTSPPSRSERHPPAETVPGLWTLANAATTKAVSCPLQEAESSSDSAELPGTGTACQFSQATFAGYLPAMDESK